MRSLVDLENRLHMKQETANEIINDIENDVKIVSSLQSRSYLRLIAYQGQTSKCFPTEV